MTVCGTLLAISVRMSLTSDAVTSALSWRANRTASLYNIYSNGWKVGNSSVTLPQVGDYISYTEIQLHVLSKLSHVNQLISGKCSVIHYILPSANNLISKLTNITTITICLTDVTLWNNSWLG